MKRVVLAILKPIVWLLFPYKVIGRENIPDASVRHVLCCNHISMVDPVFLLETYPRHIYFMAKGELFKNKLLAWVFTKFGAFPVDRGTADNGAVKTAEDLVNAGKTMGIFPEGTRSKTGELLRVKSGASLIAAHTKAAMLPVVVVTKNQKIRLFRRVKIVYGPLLSVEELHLDGEKPELRYASRLLMDRMRTMLEENR